MSIVKCSCDFEHIAFEDFLALTLTIPRSGAMITHSNSLVQCLEEYTKEERIQDEFRCSRCGDKKQCSKRTFIWRFPPILVLQFKRFHTSTWRKEKLDTLMQFPQELDLAPYKGKSRKVLWSVGHESTKESVYKLYGMIHHSGSLNFGHYTA